MVNLFWLCKPRIVPRSPNLISARNSTTVKPHTFEFDYTLCAQQHIDSHVIKIALEATQLLYNAHHSNPFAETWKDVAPKTKGGNSGYRAFNLNNPISVWIRKNIFHYRHAVSYGLALCEEYTYRYGKTHSCETHLRWLKDNEPNLPDDPTTYTSPPCAMPDEYRVGIAAVTSTTKTTTKKSSITSRRKKRKVHEQHGISTSAAVGATVTTTTTATTTTSTTAPPTDPTMLHSFVDDIYQSYQNYYIGSKLSVKMATWTKRETPDWIVPHLDKISSQSQEDESDTETKKKPSKKKSTEPTPTKKPQKKSLKRQLSYDEESDESDSS